MQGSLALANGVLWVGRHEKTAHVRAYDLDGRALGEGFSFRDPRAPRAAASGLAVDPDHRIWVADRPASRLRVFTLFGTETACVGEDARPGYDDRPLPLVDPTAVGLLETGGDDPLVLVGSGGRRRHAARAIEPGGRLVASLRPMGDPQGLFRGVRGVSGRGRLAYVAESGAGRVQVFRDLEFHFALGLGGRPFRPTAAVAAADGRVVVASAGEDPGLFLFGPGGELVARLAGPGPEDGEVTEPDDLALEDAGSDRQSRLFVLDRDGERIQVFNLEGRCYGAFAGLAG